MSSGKKPDTQSKKQFRAQKRIEGLRFQKLKKVREANLSALMGEMQLYKSLFELSPLAMVAIDGQHCILNCNPAFTALFGYLPVEAIGQMLDDLIAGVDARPEAVRLTKKVQQGEAIHATGERLRKDGTPVEVEIFGVPVCDDHAQVGMLGMYHDITERRTAERNLAYLATHDVLTGLPNRALFYEHLRTALSRARRNNEQVLVMFLDLDGFKDINDQCGHEQGDRLLRELAVRLQSCLRRGDMVARLGGDEFTFVVSGASFEIARRVALRVLQTVAWLEHLGPCQTLRVTGSLGLCLFPEDGQDGEVLLQRADAAMYSAKEAGKNTYRFYARP